MTMGSIDVVICLVLGKLSEYHWSLGRTVHHAGGYAHSNATLDVSFKNVIEDRRMQATDHILLSLEPPTIKNSAA